MKKTFCLLFSSIALGFATEAQVKMPAPSPLQTIKQDFGTESIEITYSRPSLKGRKILGKQDPWDQLWRTGANGVTKIKLNEPANIGGKLIDTGTYALYTIPRKNADWDIILNKGIKNWGTNDYKESDDVVRFKAPYTTNKKQKVETFTIQFADVKPQSVNIELSWDDWKVSFPVTVDIRDKVRAQIEKALEGEKKPYMQAANFYYEYDKDYEKALANVNKAIEGNAKGFWMYLLKAKILNDMGQIADAKTAAQKCIELATEAKNDAYVNQAKELLSKMK